VVRSCVWCVVRSIMLRTGSHGGRNGYVILVANRRASRGRGHEADGHGRAFAPVMEVVKSSLCLRMRSSGPRTEATPRREQSPGPWSGRTNVTGYWAGVGYHTLGISLRNRLTSEPIELRVDDADDKENGPEEAVHRMGTMVLRSTRPSAPTRLEDGEEKRQHEDREQEPGAQSGAQAETPRCLRPPPRNSER